MDNLQQSSWKRIVGLGTCVAWFSITGAIDSTYMLESVNIASLVFYMLFMLVAAVFNKRLAPLLLARPQVCFTFALLAAFASASSLFSDSFPLAINVLIAFFSAVGISTLLLVWGFLWSGAKNWNLVAEVVLVFIVLTVANILFSLAPFPFDAIIRSAMPAISGALLLSSMFARQKVAALATTGGLDGTSASSSSNSSDTASRVAPATLTHTSPSTTFVLRFVAAVIIISTMVSVLHNLYRFESVIGVNNFDFEVFIIKIVFLSVLLSAVLLTGKLRLVSLYRITVFAIVFSFLLFPLVGQESILPYVFTDIGYIVLAILIWVFAVQICRFCKTPPFIVFGVSYASFLGLQIFGVILALNAFFPFGTVTTLVLNIISFGGIACVLATYLFVLNEKSILRAIPDEVDFEISDQQPLDTPSAFEERWNVFCSQQGLTPRESEVLLLFAKGRSYEWIQNDLHIARGTVNFHMANVYRKLHVTNRQELLDLIESSIGFLTP